MLIVGSRPEIPGIAETVISLFLITEFLSNLLPQNAHNLCSNKVYISASIKNKYKLKNRIYYNFKDNKELINNILASCSFPYLINNKLFYKLENIHYMDGFFSDNTPLFNKNNSENQIIIKPYLFSPIDSKKFSVDKEINLKLINKGYYDMKIFLEKGEVANCFSITNNKLNTKLYLFLLLLIFIFYNIKLIFSLKKD